MLIPVSIRLDGDARDKREAEAAATGANIPTDHLALAAQAARQARRARIDADSEAVAHHVAASPEAAAFYHDWGTADRG